jgi:uncharacterized protein YjiS (DUF1127 family)
MLMSLILSKVQAWITDRDTVRELQCRDNKELSDLGICCFEISAMARKVTLA